jgi:hypothetical protein
MGGNGPAAHHTWEEVRRIACEIVDGMNEPGSAFMYECKPAVAGGVIVKEDSFVVIKKEAKNSGRAMPIALFSYGPETKITVQVKPTGYLKTYDLTSDGELLNFHGSLYDMVDEVMFQLPQIPI